MKFIILSTCFLMLMALLVPVQLMAESHEDKLQIGHQVPTFQLPDYEGKEHELTKYLQQDDTKAVVVMFIATRCPVSNAYNERMAGLYQEYHRKGIAFLGINSNRQEPVDELAKHAKQHELLFTILKDKDNVIADKYHATRTPETFVLGPEGKLLYHGAIDDNQEAPSKHYLKQALDAILSGEEVTKTETRFFGCTIKRIEKSPSE